MYGARSDDYTLYSDCRIKPYIICAQIMRAIFLLAAHASIIYTLSDPQWRASRADMWVRPVDRTSPQRRNRQSAAQSNDNTSQHHEHRQHTNNAHKRPRERLPGPWAARSSVVGRWAGGRAATLLLATPWPLRAALGPRLEARYSIISPKRLVAASRKPRRAGREAPWHASWRSRGWLWTSLHAR